MRRLDAGFVALSMLAVVTAATTDASAAGGPPPLSGFLGDDAGLAPDPKDKKQLWWEKPGFDWRAYDRILIDPIVVVPHDGARIESVSMEKVREIVDGCVAELAERVPVVDEEGPGVLRIRIAFTDIEPVNAPLNVATGALLGLRFDRGGASIEAEFLDSESGERVAAMAGTKSGSVVGVIRGSNRYGDARAACRKWARELASALETNP